MGTDVIVCLWTLCLLSLAVLAGADVGGRTVPAGRDSRVVPLLAVDALLLIGAGIGTRYGLQLGEEAPRAFGLLQDLLPVLLCVFGGVLAARWFVGGAPGRTPAWHGAAGGLALVFAFGLVFLTGGLAGIVMDSAAVLMLLIAGLLARRLGARGLRTLRLGAALSLLWAGAFLVYLRIFPAEIVVEAVGGEEGAAAAAPADPLLWVAPLVFLTAFLLGFFKRKRG